MNDVLLRAAMLASAGSASAEVSGSAPGCRIATHSRWKRLTTGIANMSEDNPEETGNRAFIGHGGRGHRPRRMGGPGQRIERGEAAELAAEVPAP